MYTPANSNIKGGFTSHLSFRWEILSREEVLQRKDDPARPIRTPSIAGGLFAISKRYFEHLGAVYHSVLVDNLCAAAPPL